MTVVKGRLSRYEVSPVYRPTGEFWYHKVSVDLVREGSTGVPVSVLLGREESSVPECSFAGACGSDVQTCCGGEVYDPKAAALKLARHLQTQHGFYNDFFRSIASQLIEYAYSDERVK